MATFTATAASKTTLGYAFYNGSTWYTGTTDGACQGAYSGASRVGVIVFSGAGAALKGRSISKITLTITCSAAGSSGSSKVLSFRRANYQSLNTNITGSAQVGTALGTLTGKFYGNTVTHTLDASTNAAFFKNFAAYLAEGNSAVVLYNGETASSGSSSNYARVTGCTINVTYVDAAVAYRDGDTWRSCTVWYRNNGAWVQCAPYYYDSGKWIPV